jgi:N-acyl-D-amino-acid deacylase
MTMSRISAAVLTVLLGLTFGLASCAPEGGRLDLLIANGRIVDGSGAPGFIGDVGIRGDTVVRVGDLNGWTADRVLDASGLVVAPGFIDMHTHADGGLGRPSSNANLNYLSQGVTTVVTGNCGGSASLHARETKAEWEAEGIGTNAVFLVGHGDIRSEVMGNEPREASQDEIEEMKEIAREAMQNGAWGISTGLEYIPGRYANTEEVIEVTKVVGEFGGVYASHMRNENSEIREAIQENVRIGEEAGVPVVVSHFKVTGKSNWGLMEDAVQTIQAARDRGVNIVADQYPYTQSSPIGLLRSFLSIPGDLEPYSELRRARRSGDLSEAERVALEERYMEELERALSDPERRERIREATVVGRPHDPSAVAMWGWEDFSVLVAEKNRHLEGTNFVDLPGAQSRDVFDDVVELLLDEPDLLYGGGSQSDADLEHALSQEWVMVSSDGSAGRIVEESAEPVRGHPRAFGSQTKILRKYVREEGLLTLEEAVRKMTSLPASFLGMKNRGILEEGYVADLVIFDPETVQDHATYADSRRYCSGVEYVIVNGSVSIEDGEYVGALNGELLLLTENE